MKKFLLIGFMAIAVMASAGNATSKCEKTSCTTEKVCMQAEDPTIVYVYFFHNANRCERSKAIGDTAQKTIEEMYVANPKVKFIEVITDDINNATLVEKNKVRGNALIIARGDDRHDLTDQAFAQIGNAPEKIKASIKDEVERLLKL